MVGLLTAGTVAITTANITTANITTSNITTSTVQTFSGATVRGKTLTGVSLFVTGGAGAAIGQAACFKAGKQLGYCSTTPTSGTCTCN